jgi:hypothetical protein
LKRWLSKTETFTWAVNKNAFFNPRKTEEDLKEGQAQEEVVNELDELSVRSDLEN